MLVKTLYSLLLVLAYFYQFLCYENILQKQYYELNRFFKVLWKHKINLLFKFVFFSLITILSFIPFHTIYLLLPFLFFIDKFKQKIISFSFTNRVKRQTLIFLLLLLILLFVECFTSIKVLFYFSIVNFILAFTLSLLCSYFIELLILNHYKKIAIVKLKTMPRLKIVGITGSYGKTSTKNYIEAFLKRNFRVCTSPASYNSLNGVLLTINQRLQPYHEILLLEIGVDKQKGMEKFLSFLSFDIGIITCIGPQHLNTFKTIDNIAKEKAKLLQSLSFSSTAIVNKDDPYLNNLDLKCHTTSVSVEKEEAIFFSSIRQKEQQTFLNVHIDDKEFPSIIRVLGRHHLINIALAIAAAKNLKVSNKTILQVLPTLKNVKHRLSFYKDENLSVIDDAYNSNFKGFNEALHLLSTFKKYKMVITPGLIEVNKEINEMYHELSITMNQTCDFVLLVGSNVNSLKKYLSIPNKTFLTFKEAYRYTKEMSKSKEIVVLLENDLPDIYI